MVSAILFAVTAATGAEIAWLFLGAGLAMVLLEATPAFLGLSSHAFVPLFATTGPWFVSTASGGTLVALGLFFLKAGAFIFGSGLAIVPFLRQGVVHDHTWLTENQFLDAVAMGLITPGPVVISATFIGYLVSGFAGPSWRRSQSSRPSSSASSSRADGSFATETIARSERSFAVPRLRPRGRSVASFC